MKITVTVTRFFDPHEVAITFEDDATSVPEAIALVQEIINEGIPAELEEK